MTLRQRKDSAREAQLEEALKDVLCFVLPLRAQKNPHVQRALALVGWKKSA